MIKTKEVGQWNATNDMATPAQLIKTVAQCLGMPVATIVGYDRGLVDAGLRTKSGRGRSVATVTARDAAHLLTAILGGGQVKDSATTVQRYAATVPHLKTSTPGGFKNTGIVEMATLAPRHSFIDALEQLVVSVHAGSIVPALGHDPRRARTGPDESLEVAALSPGTVGDIRIVNRRGKHINVRYSLAGPVSLSRREGTKSQSWQSRIAMGAESDLEQFRKLSGRTIGAIGKLLEERK